MQTAVGALQWTTDQATYTDAGDTSQAVIYSEPVHLPYLYLLAFQVLFAGGLSPVGSLSVQISLSGSAIPPNGKPNTLLMTWSDLDASYTVAVSADGSKAFNINGAAYLWARLKYTKTSGGGLAGVTARVCGKGTR